MNYSKQRDLILKIVKENRIHPTVEWVHGEAKKKMPHIGMATVYRNLNILVDNGLIERISIPGEPVRFDGFTGEHFHMKCIKCGKLIDLSSEDPESLNQLKTDINSIFGINAGDIKLCTMLLEGTCNKCQSIK